MSTATRAEDESAGFEFFELNVRPVLVQNCYKCHSSEAQENGKLKGGLLLDTREGIRRGGESGPAVVPGNEKKSLLLSAVRHEDFEMPPKGRLPDGVVDDLVKWIQIGAPDPRDGTARVAEAVDLEGGRDFWSFQPLAHPDLSNEAQRSLSTAIDEFVAARRTKAGLEPVEPATAEVLVRRLYFDLVGLPPSPEERDRWVDAIGDEPGPSRDRAIGELVDLLLASPEFGERWGRHWLDVARYAESNGNSRNATFPHAWRYRDYVIDAFNADTRYDRFVIEQIAGDLLPFDSVEDRNRNLVATGFLALGSKPVIRGAKGGFVPDVVADQIEVTSRAVLGLTVACARCHDHKFDPIPTTDYYGLAGIFASSQTLYGGGGNSMGGAPATGLHVLADPDPERQRAYEEWKSTLDDLVGRQKQVNDQLKKLRPKRRKGQKPPDPTGEQRKRLEQLTAEQRKLGVELKRHRSNSVEPPGSAMGIREAARVTEVPVYVRGVSAKGSPVSRRFVSVVAGEDGLGLPDDSSGRLELARWLVAPENPLASRVMVNRVWLHLFGEGLVRTPDNLGTNGERPSHPELLDHLAASFVEHGWSVKRLIRQIVTSRTYQLGDAHHDVNYERDPDNVFLWRHSRRRLEAEAIRDAILVAAGTLETERPVGSVVTVHGGKLIQDGLTPDKIHQPSNHRSVYLPILRNGLPESLEVFDLADPSLVVGRRSVTTVPAQDLYLMNNEFVIRSAESFADRILKLDDDSARIDVAYRIAVSRPPTSGERERALAFVADTTTVLGETDEARRAGWAAFCQALFVSAEFRQTR